MNTDYDFDESADKIPCPDCGGTGYMPDGSMCEKCDGWGEVEEPEADREDYLNPDEKMEEHYERRK